MDRIGENSREKANLKRWVLSFERNVESDNESRVSGGREFQSLNWSNVNRHDISGRENAENFTASRKILEKVAL